MRWIVVIFALMSLCVSGASAWKMEANKITVKSTTATTFSFRQTYDNPPLVFLIADSDGGNPASIRITHVTTSGFQAYVVEPQGSDGPHYQQEKISYIAIEEGSHQLPDGTRIVAGTIATRKHQGLRVSGTDWESVSLGGAFSSAPAVLAMIQTANSEANGIPPAASDPKVSSPWLTTAVEDLDSSGFKIALERSETNDGSITSNETIAYLAIDANVHGADTYFGDNQGNKITYETIWAEDGVNGWDNGGKDIAFRNSYSDSPVVVATKNSRNGNNGGWLRSGAGANEGSPTDHINLRVDEDVAFDSERGHVNEDVSIVVFSAPFDAEFIESGQAEMKTNELLYQEASSGNNNEEFVEFYVTQTGNLKNFVVLDQDCNYYIFPDHHVDQGDYVLLFSGDGTDGEVGNVHKFYKNGSTIWNNSNDDLLLIYPALDATTTTNTSACGTETFNGYPFDYIAYGRNSTGGNVDSIPTSLNGTTVSWTYSGGNGLRNADDLQSISLTPNNTDSDKAEDWEKTTTDTASGPITIDHNTDSVGSTPYVCSDGYNNNGEPNIAISKTSIVTHDPVNGNSHPKRIPGATIRYCFTVDNTGDGIAENATIDDSLTGSGRDNLTYVNSGSIIQDIAVACDCTAISTTNGTVSGRDVTIIVGDINGTGDTAHSRGCAYIETTIQ